MHDGHIWTSELKDTISDCLGLQDLKTKKWHKEEPSAPKGTAEASFENLKDLALREHLHNFTLWHIEDSARRMDVGDDVIADCKRNIDKENQLRNDGIERIDECLLKLLQPHLPKAKESIFNTETPGMAMDRLSILSLKIFHMQEQVDRNDVDEEHRKKCREKLDILKNQRAGLKRSLFALIREYLTGTKVLAVYYQFKMYNDPKLNPELYKK